MEKVEKKITAKEYLRQIRRYDVQIRSRREEIEQMGGGPEDLAYPSGPVGPGRNPNMTDKVGSIVAKFADLEGEIVKIQRKREAIIAKIESLPCAMSMEVLLHRYVHGCSIKETSVKVDRSYRYTKEIHKKALILFEETHNLA